MAGNHLGQPARRSAYSVRERVPVALADSNTIRVPIERTRTCDLLGKKQSGGVSVSPIGRAQERVHLDWRTALRQNQIWNQEVLYSGLFNQAEAGIHPLQLIDLVLGEHTHEDALSLGWLTKTSPQWSSTTALSSSGTIWPFTILTSTSASGMPASFLSSTTDAFSWWSS